MNAEARTNARRPFVAVVAVAIVTLAGCAGGRRAAEAPTPGASLDEAHRLAVQAQAAQGAGDLDRAVELNRQALGINGDLGGVWNNLGVALLARDRETTDVIDAGQAFKRAADLLPTDPRPYENLGTLYHQRGFADDALRYYALSLERDPNWPASLRGAVDSARRLRKSDEPALARVRRAIMIERDPAWVQTLEFERIRIENDLAEPGRPRG